MPSWDSLEPGVRSPRGRRAAAVSADVYSNMPHQAGSKHGGLVGVCAYCPDAVRIRGQEYSEAASLTLSTLRLPTLADKAQQGGASRRPSVLAGPMLRVVV